MAIGGAEGAPDSKGFDGVIEVVSFGCSACILKKE